MDGEGIVEPVAHLPRMSEGEQVVEDYIAMRLTLRRHPMSFLRARLSSGIDTPRNTPVPGRSFADARGLTRSDAWAKDDEGGGLKCMSARH